MTAPDPTPRVDTAAIRSLADAATEGPWEEIDLGAEVGEGENWWWVWRSAARPYYGGVMHTDGDFTVRSEHGLLYRVAGAIGELEIEDSRPPAAQERADAAFIAAARTAVPALCDEVDRLRAVVEAVGALADAFDGYAKANEPLAAGGSWKSAGYANAYSKAADDLRAAIDSVTGGAR